MIFFVKAQFIVFILGATSQYLFEEKTKKEATNKTNNGMTDKAKAKYEGGNLAASKIRNLECPNYEICLIDYGCGKFNRKIHIMEQYP